MYLLRAGKEAAIRARLLPQRNSSIPCPAPGVRAVAEPSPGTVPLHKAAGPLLPGRPRPRSLLATSTITSKRSDGAMSFSTCPHRGCGCFALSKSEAGLVPGGAEAAAEGVGLCWVRRVP